MLIVVSPAKTLDYDSPLPSLRATQPRLLEHSAELVERARKLSPADLASLMKVSDKIAHLNVERFAQWSRPFDKHNARPALFAFKGDVYTGLDVSRFDGDDLKAAQSRLRILSGLYGVLRPLDLMQPYRLEMGTRLDNERGKDLYQFWGDINTAQLKKDMKAAGTEVLVNLASNEYFKSVRTEQQMQPFSSSTVSSKACSIRRWSIPISPNSFTITAVSPIPGWRTRWFNKVVFPLPRKPVMIETGIMHGA